MRISNIKKGGFRCFFVNFNKKYVCNFNLVTLKYYNFTK